MRHLLSSRIWASAAVLAAALTQGPACTSPTEPDALRAAEGAWTLSFNAGTFRFCSAGFEMPVGCSGAGMVDLRVSGSSLAVASSSGRGGCQTCTNAIDYTLASVSASVEGERLFLRVGPSCVLAADLPVEGAQSVSGEAVCSVGDNGTPASGPWQMTRLTR